MNPDNQNPIPPTQPVPDILPTGVPTEQNPVNPQPPNPPVTQEVPKPKIKLLPVLIILLALIGLGSLGYRTYQKYFVSSQPTPEAVISTPVATENPTANWKTYINPVKNFSFKYPQSWTIDTKDEMGDDRKENVVLKLSSNQAQITIYADMVGIGGQGQNYEGKPFILDRNNLYLYRKANTYDSTQVVGITDSLTESLGVFRVKDKTYSITISYPLSTPPAEASEIERGFDQILSTFKFIN